MSQKIDNDDWKSIKRFGGDRTIAKKIIFIFNSQLLPVFKTDHLEHFYDELFGNSNLPYDYNEMSLGQKYEFLSNSLLEIKNKSSTMKDWSNPYYSAFLYEMYPRKKMETAMKVFISYSTQDTERFFVHELAEHLENNPSIEKVSYWEGWNGFPDGDIVKFMEENITNSDIFIGICTNASKNSLNCEKERRIAFFQNKRYIPIYENFNDVPPSFQPYLGVDITNKSTDEIFEKVQSLLGIIKVKKPKINKEIESSEFREELMDYHGVKLVKSDYEQMLGLEKELGQIIPVTALEFNSFGYVPKNRRVYHLGLSGGIIKKSVPKEAFRFKSLNTLYINNSPNLTEISDEIGNLSELVLLKLEQNKLEKLPDTIGNLKSLNNLIVKGNNLNILPESIGKMHALEFLDLSNNSLDFFPDELTNLKNLKDINFGNNKIAFLPDDFGDLTSLVKIEAYLNKLTFLPDSMKNMKNIKYYNLGNNPLEIPGWLKERKKENENIELFY